MNLALKHPIFNISVHSLTTVELFLNLMTTIGNCSQ